MTDAKNFSEFVYKEPCGQWSEPDKNHLIELMRHAYNNRGKIKEMGNYAGEYVKKTWLWKDKIKMFHSELNKFL